MQQLHRRQGTSCGAALFWRTVRERSRCVCGGHQGTKDVILRVRGRSGGDMLVVLLPSEDRWIVVAGLADRVRSGQVSSRGRSAGNEPTLPPDSTTRPRCSRMRIEMERWTDQDPSRDSASGSQKATLRLTNEPLGDSSPRHLVPSIRPHGLTHLSYMTSRNALRHVLARLARTTPSPSARRSPRTSESI